MDGNVPKGDDRKVKKQCKTQAGWVWPVKIFVLAVALSVFFSIVSEYLLGASKNAVVKLIIAIVVIIIFIVLAIITDMIGVAVTASDEEPFRAMASKKVRGAKQALMLIKNNDRVASFCNDVVGDVCGILSGAAGASIATIIIFSNAGSALSIIVSALISGLIAGFTILGKAIGKTYAIKKSSNIILRVGKLLSIFSKKEKGGSSNKKTK